MYGPAGRVHDSDEELLGGTPSGKELTIKRATKHGGRHVELPTQGLRCLPLLSRGLSANVFEGNHLSVGSVRSRWHLRSFRHGF